MPLPLPLNPPLPSAASAAAIVYGFRCGAIWRTYIAYGVIGNGRRVLLISQVEHAGAYLHVLSVIANKYVSLARRATPLDIHGLLAGPMIAQVGLYK